MLVAREYGDDGGDVWGDGIEKKKKAYDTAAATSERRGQWEENCNRMLLKKNLMRGTWIPDKGIAPASTASKPSD